MAGSHDDAMLMVELAKWGTMSGLPEGWTMIFADDFDPDAVEAADPAVRAQLYFHETVGTLVKNGLLDRDLVYDWLWVSGVWDRVGLPQRERGRRRARRPSSTKTSRRWRRVSVSVAALSKVAVARCACRPWHGRAFSRPVNRCGSCDPNGYRGPGLAAAR